MSEPLDTVASMPPRKQRGGIIATGDPNDLRSLARDHANIEIQALS
jgi:hypothetical protein